MPLFQTHIYLIYNAFVNLLFLVELKKKKKLREHEEMWITYYFCQTEKKYADEFFCNIICKNLFDNSRSTQNKVPSLSNKVRGDVLYSLNRLLTHRNPLT